MRRVGHRSTVQFMKICIRLLATGMGCLLFMSPIISINFCSLPIWHEIFFLYGAKKTLYLETNLEDIAIMMDCASLDKTNRTLLLIWYFNLKTYVKTEKIAAYYLFLFTYLQRNVYDTDRTVNYTEV